MVCDTDLFLNLSCLFAIVLLSLKAHGFIWEREHPVQEFCNQTRTIPHLSTIKGNF